MKALIVVAALAASIISHSAFAQDSSNTPPSAGLRPAPIGHRQPTAADVKRAQAERGVSGPSTASPKPSDLDQRLIICQGC
jgi:hypothetical protein